MPNKILVTGGAGYIGSNVTLELLRANYDVVVVDSLANSNVSSLQDIERLSGKAPDFHETDIRDSSAIDKVFKNNDIFGIIHLAGLKSVGNSFRDPVGYYDSNVSGSITLIKAALTYGCNNFIFSSSASVYGYPEMNPVVETAALKPINPYGRTKKIVEVFLQDICDNNSDFKACSLRYFNPLGAEASGLLGESPIGTPNNIMPYLTQVAIGQRNELQVFGDGYDTPDGTGIRDYIHVVDLAKGHLKALEYLTNEKGSIPHPIFNLGTGTGYSVLDLIKTFERVTGVKVAYRIVEPREGDAAISFADPSLAKKLLNWTADLDLDEMCRTQWAWQCSHPNGYHNE